jgi:hypothetical protein
MEKLKKYYFSRLTADGGGFSLSPRQLWQYAKRKHLTTATTNDDSADLPASKKNIDLFLQSQSHRTPFSRADRVKHFQTVGVPRAGMYHIDYGEFHKDWSGSNKGFTGFLVAVENFTNRLFVEPCKGKGTAEWLRAIQTFGLIDFCDYFIYSSGYDHVLLESYLVPYLYEKQFYPKLERRGNKLSTIRTRTGINFRDVTKLLAPSTNLRSFGELSNRICFTLQLNTERKKERKNRQSIMSRKDR